MAVAFLPKYFQYLGVEAYGLVGVFAVVQAIIAILDMGMSPTLNREMARFEVGQHRPEGIRNLLRSLEIICYLLALGSVLIVWLCGDYLAHGWLKAEHLSAEEVSKALVLMSIVAALRLCEGIYCGALFGLEQQVWYNFTYSVLSTLRYFGALAVLSLYSATIESFFMWQIVVSLLSLMVLAARVHHSLPKVMTPTKFSMRAILEIWKFAGGMMGIAFVTMLFLQLDKVLLSRLVSLSDLGYYTLAATAANIIFMIVVPVTQAIYPRLVKFSLDVDTSNLAHIYHNTSQLVAVTTATASMLLSFYSGGVIFMWSGNLNLVQHAAPLLSILVIGSFLNGLSYLPCQLQIAHGWTSPLVKLNSLLIVLFVPSIVFLVSTFGTKGAAWGWVLINAINLIAIIKLMHGRILPGHQKKWYVSDLLMPTCGALIVMVLAQEYAPSNYSDRFQWVEFLIFTGVLGLVMSTLLSSAIRYKAYKWIKRGSV